MWSKERAEEKVMRAQTNMLKKGREDLKKDLGVQKGYPCFDMQQFLLDHCH